MTRSQSRALPLFLGAAGLAVLFARCHRTRAPEVTPSAVLALPASDVAPSPANAPFGVVFASPDGEATAASEVTVMFNRPMRALELAGADVPTPVRLLPTVPGEWHWVGTSAVTFRPRTRLAYATDYVLEVDKGTRSLGGDVMAAPFSARFATAAPTIVRSDPPDGASHVAPTDKIALRWNQPVADADVARSVRLLAGQATLAFDVRHPDPDNAMLVELTPRAPLPKARALALVVGTSMRGSEGPRSPAAEQKLAWHTYGPLAVTGIECDRDTPHRRCAANGSLSLSLTNDVSIGQLKRALVLDPPLPLQWDGRADDDVTRYVNIDARFMPSSTVTVKLRATTSDAHGAAAKLRDVYEQPLASDYVTQVAFDELWPSAELGVKGVYLEGAARDLPIHSVNLPTFKLATLALGRDQILQLVDLERSGKNGIDLLLGLGATVTEQRPTAARDAVATTWIKGSEVLGGADRRGPVGVGFAFAERPASAHTRARAVSRARVVQMTDLGVSAKLSPDGAIVWVTRLSTGEPVAGASVEIRRASVDGGGSSGEFRTDADGFAQIPKERFAPRSEAPETATVFVRTGDDWCYRRVADALRPWRFGVTNDASAEPGTIGMMFSDRGIYRPGDTVNIKGIARAPAATGLVTRAGAPLAVRVTGPNGEALSTRQQTLSAFGTFAVDARIPATGKLGSYAVSAKLDGAPESDTFRASFEVAEYRPVEFKVATTPVLPASAIAATPAAFTRGDAGRWSLSAEYLFGAPMADAEVRYTVSRGPATFSPAVPEGFTTSDSAYQADLTSDASPRVTQLLQGTGRLDASGRLAIEVPLAMPGQLGPEQVTCEAEVTDVSRQSLAGQSSTLVHPGELYVAIKSGVDFFAKAGAPARPEIVVVDTAGVRRPRVAAHVELVHRSYALARQSAGGGALHNEVSTVDDVVGTCDVESATEPVSCALVPKAGGYHLLRATARDVRGHVVSASQGFYVMGEGQAGWGDHDDRRVELVADKASYRPGETAHILVKSPFKSADAWVTVERTGVYSRTRTRLEGTTPTIDVPISDTLRPNAFVSVLMVKGRTAPPPTQAGALDVGAPTFRVGYASLPVDPEGRKLQVTLHADKSVYAPGDPIAVDVDVRDRAQQPARAEVTLYAVDEGVLSLIGYQTPDPLAVFSAPRPLLVTTLESRDALGAVISRGQGAFPLLDKGLEGGGGDSAGGSGVRRDFRQSAYFNAALVTDAAGRARATFKLPDSLTSYRIMAVAVAEDDRFGSAAVNVVASRPLMARPAFPRVLRAGDVIDAGVVLTSKGLAASRVTVEAKATGLELLSSAKQTVNLGAETSSEVRFRFRAPAAGTAKVTFAARSDVAKASDSVEISKTVLSPAALEAVALYGETSTVAGEKLGDLSGMRTDVGQLELTLASTALTGLGGGVQQLIEYPYGCTEQLTSRLVALLPLADLARDFQLELPKDVASVVARTVAAVLKSQRDDGGFGSFPSSDRSWPWASVYALWGLGEAQRRGVDVPASALVAATGYVRGQLDQWERSNDAAATAAFVVAVLAENGAREPAWLERLFQARGKLPLFAKALLLQAIAQGGGDRAAMGELVAEIERQVRIDGKVARAVVNTGDAYAALLDSEVRTSALVLRALLSANPAHPLGSRLAMGLLADRRGGVWRSTQETAWALLAVDAYRRAQESVVPAFDARAFLGNTEVLSTSFQGRSTVSRTAVLPAGRALQGGGSTLAFAVNGTGRLFYEARLRYARRDLPNAPIDRGFFVEKRLTRVRPEELAAKLRELPAHTSSGEFAGADLVLADVVVVTPTPRHFVAIDDPLPAGLEAVDSRLATSASSLDVDEALAAAEARRRDRLDEESDRRATGEEMLSTQAVREVHDDRVVFFVEHMTAGVHRFRYLARATTLGTFVVPPTWAGEMYAPEVFGRTAASTVTVRGRTP